MKPQLIQNAVYNPFDQKFYVSRHRHDYVSIPLEDNKFGFIDGGNCYQRIGFQEPYTFIDYCLYEDSTDEEKRDKMLWGTYGKNGDEPLHYVLLKDCNSEHLSNILNIPNLCPYIEKVILQVLNSRKE